MPKSCLDFMDTGIGIRDAGHRARCVPHFIENTGQLRDDDACLPASRTSCKHHMVFATPGVSLFIRELHGEVSQSTASVMYFGMPDSLSTCLAAIWANRAFPKRLAVARTES